MPTSVPSAAFSISFGPASINHQVHLANYIYSHLFLLKLLSLVLSSALLYVYEYHPIWQNYTTPTKLPRILYPLLSFPVIHLNLIAPFPEPFISLPFFSELPREVYLNAPSFAPSYARSLLLFKLFFRGQGSLLLLGLLNSNNSSLLP